MFSSAYAGNPASILGHTILRLHLKRESLAPGARALTDYVVGYAAATDPTDSRGIYMLKGIFGGYPGMFSLEPYYMKIGVYNNSESRDLWEYPLRLTEEEIELFRLHLWEAVHWTREPYYFFSRNCSYQLLALLETVRPDLRVTENLSWPVMPLDTIRALEEAGLLSGETGYRSSIFHRMRVRWNRMNFEQRERFLKARRELAFVQSETDPLVLDALIDYWTQRNYEKETKLPPEEAALMNATFTFRAALGQPSVAPTDGDVRDELRLNSPLASHKPSVLGVGAFSHEEKAHGYFSYQMGVHAFWHDSTGLEGVANIEFMKAAAWLDEKGNSPQWRLTFADVSALEDFSWLTKSLSWRMRIQIESADPAFYRENSRFTIEGGAGLTWIGDSFLVFLMPSLKGSHSGRLGFGGLGVAPGFRWSPKKDLRVTAQLAHYWGETRHERDYQVRIVKDWSRDLAFSAVADNDFVGAQAEWFF